MAAAVIEMGAAGVEALAPEAETLGSEILPKVEEAGSQALSKVKNVGANISTKAESAFGKKAAAAAAEESAGVAEKGASAAEKSHTTFDRLMDVSSGVVIGQTLAKSDKGGKVAEGTAKTLATVQAAPGGATLEQVAPIVGGGPGPGGFFLAILIILVIVAVAFYLFAAPRVADPLVFYGAGIAIGGLGVSAMCWAHSRRLL